MRAFPRRLLMAALAVAVLTGLALVSDAAAVQKGKKKKNAQLVQTLVDARTLVHNANHDYKGYRAKAAHRIRQAIHALEPKHKHPPLPPVKGNNEPQAQSDMQLRQALMLLQSVQTQLNGLTGQHHINANTHVTNAINDLQTALKII